MYIGLQYRRSQRCPRATAADPPVESASDAISITDVTGKSIYHNPAFVARFGYEVAELNTPGGALSLYAEPAVARAIFGTLVKGQSWAGEVLLQNHQGAQLHNFL